MGQSGEMCSYVAANENDSPMRADTSEILHPAKSMNLTETRANRSIPSSRRRHHGSEELNHSYSNRTGSRRVWHHLRSRESIICDKGSQEGGVQSQERVRKRSAIMQEMVSHTTSRMKPGAFAPRNTKTRKETRSSNKITNTIEMCHSTGKWLLLASLMLPLFLTIICVAPQMKVSATTASRQNKQAYKVEPALEEDLFAPTRSNMQVQDVFGLRSGETSQQQSAAEPKRAESRPKPFTRMNELDVFLDDMNHNELRAVASGKPIGNSFFQARPLTGQQQQQQQAAPKSQRDEHERSLRSGQRAVNSSGSDSASVLDESQSQQQIYSECALILQRTYVKNIDNPA